MMSDHKKRSVFFGSLFLLSMLWTATGCIKDDNTDCAAICRLNVRAYASVGGADVSAEVNDVVLYVFDKDDLFVEQIVTRIGENVVVRVPKDESVTIIGWGNLSGGNQTCTEFEPGDPLNAGCVDLAELTRSGMAVGSPNDLFHGTLALSYDDLTRNQEIPLFRKTGSMAITLRGLKQYFGFDDGDYSVKVNANNRAIDFGGDLTSGAVTYSPVGSFNAAGDFIIPSFNLLADEGVTVEIYHDGVLIAIISLSDDSVISVAEGLTTNLLINYLGSLSVTINITAWGTETIWKEY